MLWYKNVANAVLRAAKLGRRLISLAAGRRPMHDHIFVTSEDYQIIVWCVRQSME